MKQFSWKFIDILFCEYSMLDFRRRREYLFFPFPLPLSIFLYTCVYKILFNLSYTISWFFFLLNYTEVNWTPRAHEGHLRCDGAITVELVSSSLPPILIENNRIPPKLLDSKFFRPSLVAVVQAIENAAFVHLTQFY